jgi:hypothetical protein
VGYCLAADVERLHHIDSLIAASKLDNTEYEYARLLEGIAAAGTYAQLRGTWGLRSGGDGGEGSGCWTWVSSRLQRSVAYGGLRVAWWWGRAPFAWRGLPGARMGAKGPNTSIMTQTATLASKRSSCDARRDNARSFVRERMRSGG